MKTLNRAIFSEWLRGFSVSLILLILAVFFIQSSRISSLLFSLAPDAPVFLYTLLLLLPAWLVLCIPMAHMFSCLTLALRYRREGEIRAMQTLGLGSPRLLGPMLALGLCVGIITAFMSLYVEPQAKNGANNLLLQMASGAAQSRIVAGEIVQLTPDLALYAAARNGDALENVFLAQNDNASGERVLWAQKAAIEKSDTDIVLKLENGGLVERGRHNIKGAFASFNLRMPLLSSQGGLVFPPLQTASSLSLLSAFSQRDKAFELLRRLAIPTATLFLGAVVLLAAFVFPASLPYLAWLFSLLLLAAYYLAGRLGEILAFDKEFPVGLAATAPLLVLLTVLLLFIVLNLRRRTP